MSTANLVISPSSSTLPTCNPNLMPFHIDYTGPAAVSAYMRVDKLQPENATVESVVEEVTEKKVSVKVTTEVHGDTAVVEAETTTTTTTTITDIVMGDPTPTTPSKVLSAAASEDTIVVESQESTSSVASSSTPPLVLEDADRRFVSTFRGRTIHGLTVDLPEGYGGLLLKSTGKENMEGQSDDTKTKQAWSKAKPAAKAKAKAVEEAPAKPRGRVTRSAAAPKQTAPIEIDDTAEDEEMADAVVDASASDPSQDQPVRELIPTAQFPSFTLWHADRPVDKGRDEYTRTLTEWISLAHEIHCSDL
ncbi:hypothetical protein D9619_006781 [Psilocybe cf. subviscida]|uniref:Uncharacterized protein n=1 Tax=Psilocybe cf. subviscida TaxID=2480587 RepID=A0A8H5B556_9AGAR|nr:hypothetical protein D9619_006781 [Psilocybe cf. subviscida]